MTNHKPLKFAHGKRPLIATGEKTATVRYDDEKDISEGDVLSMRAQTGDEFATAEVAHVIVCPAWEALEYVERFDATHECSNWDELCSVLNKHYDDAITRTTKVKVIAWATPTFTFTTDDSPPSLATRLRRAFHRSLFGRALRGLGWRVARLLGADGHGKGHDHTDDREPLAYVYQASDLLAVCYHPKEVARYLEETPHTVSFTPEGRNQRPGIELWRGVRNAD